MDARTKSGTGDERPPSWRKRFAVQRQRRTLVVKGAASQAAGKDAFDHGPAGISDTTRGCLASRQKSEQRSLSSTKDELVMTPSGRLKIKTYKTFGRVAT
jgi:hypothetical protein